MTISGVFKVAVALSVFFVGMGVAASAEPPSVKAQGATKKHGSFAADKAGNTQAPRQVTVQPLPPGEDITALRGRIARGEKLMERDLPVIKTPEKFTLPLEPNPSESPPSQQSEGR